MHRGFLLKCLIGTCLVATALCAQAPIQPDLEKLYYPALARSARIQGTVKFTVNHGDTELVSGHPWLVQAAKDNLQTWAPSQIADAELEVSYVFRLSDRISMVEREEPIGNPVSRAFRRLFHMPTTRIVKVADCAGRRITKSFRNVSEGGRPTVEVTVEAEATCVEPNRSYVASLRHQRDSTGAVQLVAIGSGVAAPSDRGSDAP